MKEEPGGRFSSLEYLGDDASYLLARMGAIDPHAFKARVLRNLLLGGADELAGQVHQINEASHPPGS